MNQRRKSLKLTRETLRALAPRALQQVAGGDLPATATCNFTFTVVACQTFDCRVSLECSHTGCTNFCQTHFDCFIK